MQNKEKNIYWVEIKEEEKIVFDFRIPSEHEQPLDAGICYNAWNYAIQQGNNCANQPMTNGTNQQPMYEQEYQHTERFDTGESLCVMGNETLAVSEGRTTVVAGETIRNNYNHVIRTLYTGEIINCKRVRYENEDGEEFFYEITTKGYDGNLYKFEIDNSDFENKLFKILSAKGKLKFKRQRKNENDETWISSVIAGTAVENEFLYPFYPRWINGKYCYSGEEHMAKTPFFQNIIRVANTNTTEFETCQNVMKALNLFRKPGLRLFFLILSSYSILQSRIPDAIKVSIPFAINISKELSLFVEPYLNIFTSKTGARCSTSEDIKQLKLLKQKRKGTIAFYYNGIAVNGYYATKATGNIENLVTSHDRDTVTVIVNKDPVGYVLGAFNVLIRDEDFDAKECSNVNEIKTYLAKFLLGFAAWMGERGISVEELCERMYGDGNAETCFKVIYTLLNAYNNAISESTLAEKLGFGCEEEALTAIKEICAESDCYRGGEWVFLGKIPYEGEVLDQKVVVKVPYNK